MVDPSPQVFCEVIKSSVVLASHVPLCLQDPNSCMQLAAGRKVVGLMVVMSVLKMYTLSSYCSLNSVVEQVFIQDLY